MQFGIDACLPLPAGSPVCRPRPGVWRRRRRSCFPAFMAGWRWRCASTSPPQPESVPWPPSPYWRWRPRSSARLPTACITRAVRAGIWCWPGRRGRPTPSRPVDARGEIPVTLSCRQCRARPCTACPHRWRPHRWRFCRNAASRPRGRRNTRHRHVTTTADGRMPRRRGHGGRHGQGGLSLPRRHADCQPLRTANGKLHSTDHKGRHHRQGG